jgi:hypothetical protein
VTTGMSVSSSPSDHGPNDSPTSALRSIRICRWYEREGGGGLLGGAG